MQCVMFPEFKPIFKEPIWHTTPLWSNNMIKQFRKKKRQESISWRCVLCCGTVQEAASAGSVTAGSARLMRGGSGMLIRVKPDSQVEAGGQITVYETFPVM